MASKGLKRTCKVGSYPPNRLGLYDIHGNVWEWCADTVVVGKQAALRVFRGGGWMDDSGNCRAVNRIVSTPLNRAIAVGLRLALVPIGKEKK